MVSVNFSSFVRSPIYISKRQRERYRRETTLSLEGRVVAAREDRLPDSRITGDRFYRAPSSGGTSQVSRILEIVRSFAGIPPTILETFAVAKIPATCSRRCYRRHASLWPRSNLSRASPQSCKIKESFDFALLFTFNKKCHQIAWHQASKRVV